jgi:hypothetical protein
LVLAAQFFDIPGHLHPQIAVGFGCSTALRMSTNGWMHA